MRADDAATVVLDAVTLVSRRFAEAIRGVLPVAITPAPGPLRRATVALAWHPRFDADPAHAWLRDQIRAVATRRRRT